MGIESLRGLHAENVVFAEKENCAGRVVTGSDAIDQNHCVQSDDAMRQVERGSAEIGDLDAVAEAVLGFQKTSDVGSNGIVAEQHIADAADQDSRAHRILATAIFRPAGSKA